MRPTRGLGSAPLPPANRGCALLFGLAPGGVCRVSLRPRGAGIVTVALVLASRRTGVTRHPALGSSDFPHAGRLPGRRATIRPPRWPAQCRRTGRGNRQGVTNSRVVPLASRRRSPVTGVERKGRVATEHGEDRGLLGVGGVVGAEHRRDRKLADPDVVAVERVATAAAVAAGLDGHRAVVVELEPGVRDWRPAVDRHEPPRPSGDAFRADPASGHQRCDDREGDQPGGSPMASILERRREQPPHLGRHGPAEDPMADSVQVHAVRRVAPPRGPTRPGTPRPSSRPRPGTAAAAAR